MSRMMSAAKMIVLLAFVCGTFLSAPLPALQAEIPTYAESAALIDVQSGRILWSHQGDKQMLIASTTKIMTAIVAIEQGQLSDQVTVSANAFGKEGSSLYLRNGEKMSLEHLLYGMMLRSGNDAATAIAEHVGGSVEGFALLMNEKAKEIGMERSHFVNPHGLNADGHYSTANDMAKLAAYALRNSVFREIVKTKVKQAPNPNDEWNYKWYNKNKMLSLYEGADGVKTGYTRKAGRCLVSSASRDGRQLAAVTLNDGNDWADHARMLDYGFSHFPSVEIVEEGETVEDAPGYAAARSFHYPLADEEREAVTTKAVLYTPTSLENRLGRPGRIDIYLHEDRVGSVPLVESADTFAIDTSQKIPDNQRPGLWYYFTTTFKELFRWSI